MCLWQTDYKSKTHEVVKLFLGKKNPRLSGVSGTRNLCAPNLIWRLEHRTQNQLFQSLEVRLFDEYAIDHLALAVLDLVVCHLNAALNLDAVLLSQNG